MSNMRTRSQNDDLINLPSVLSENLQANINAPNYEGDQPQTQSATLAPLANEAEEATPQGNQQNTQSQSEQLLEAEGTEQTRSKLEDPLENSDTAQQAAQKLFYRQLGSFVGKNKHHFRQLLFYPDEILHCFQSAGLEIVAPQFIVKDDQVDSFKHGDVLDFLAECITGVNEIEKVIEYCAQVNKGTASVDRFRTVDVNELALTMSKAYKADLNPLLRPRFAVEPFGEFSVESISQDAQDLLRRNEKAKFNEFAHAYQVGSWLFDAGCELLKFLHLSSLGVEECQALALITQNVWTQFKTSNKRLVQLYQFASADPAKRQLALLKYKQKSTSLLLDKEALDVEEKAATIQAKQVSSRFKDTSASGSRTWHYNNKRQFNKPYSSGKQQQQRTFYNSWTPQQSGNYSQSFNRNFQPRGSQPHSSHQFQNTGGYTSNKNSQDQKKTN